jgi:hypothetical protein
MHSPVITSFLRKDPDRATDMDNTTNPAQPEIEDRLPWHKPQVRRLTVSLDTAFEAGSDTDGQATGSVTISAT